MKILRTHQAGFVQANAESQAKSQVAAAAARTVSIISGLACVVSQEQCLTSSCSTDRVSCHRNGVSDGSWLEIKNGSFYVQHPARFRPDCCRCRTAPSRIKSVYYVEKVCGCRMRLRKVLEARVSDSGVPALVAAFLGARLPQVLLAVSACSETAWDLAMDL